MVYIYERESSVSLTLNGAQDGETWAVFAEFGPVKAQLYKKVLTLDAS